MTTPDLDALLARVENTVMRMYREGGLSALHAHPVEELAAACRALRSDAARYQWLKEADESNCCRIVWREKYAEFFRDVDAAIDAARGA